MVLTEPSLVRAPLLDREIAAAGTWPSRTTSPTSHPHAVRQRVVGCSATRRRLLVAVPVAVPPLALVPGPVGSPATNCRLHASTTTPTELAGSPHGKACVPRRQHLAAGLGTLVVASLSVRRRSRSLRSPCVVALVARSPALRRRIPSKFLSGILHLGLVPTFLRHGTLDHVYTRSIRCALDINRRNREPVL